MGGGKNPQLSSAPQHETKKSRKNLLPLFALLLLMALAPKTTWAQQHTVPYGATVIAGYIPQDWVTSNNYGPIPYNGLDYYAFSTGIIVLPELDAPTNTLTVDVNIQPFVNPVYGSIFRIGYITDVNDFSTFHELEDSWYMYELPWEGDLRCKRAVFSGVPENARIAFVTIYEWFIQSVLVYETPDPFDVPYSLPSFQSGVGQNEGWMINDYVSYYQYFREGTALLPEFNSSLNLLEMDVLIKPYDYSAQNIEVGYVTNPNSPSSNWNFVSVQSFNASSSWTGFMPKRISYSSAPSGARMAISCNGRWEFNNIYVYNPASTVYSLPYQYSFGQTLPGGWLSNNYGYYDGTAFLTDGIAVLPNFQYDTWRELELDLAAMPRNSQARNIKIGYITDPNDPSTFVDVQTFYSNTSSWTEIQPKRVDYAGIAAGARLAIQCNGDWNIRDVAVRYKPSTIYPTQSNPYHLATFDTNQPEGWIANSYVNEGLFKTGVNQLPRLNSAVSINSLFLDVDIKPSSSNTSFSLGYVTTSQAVTTFTALKTFSSSTDWTDFRIQRLDFNDVPSGARMAISFAGEWTIRDVKLYPTPSPTAVPYNPTLGEGQPDGWMANNYGYSSGNAYLNNGLAILPQFNAEISTLLLDIALKPKNSSARNIKLGYVTDPNNPSTFVATHTYVNSSWEYYLPKRMRFVSAPAGARLAILCDGDWNIAGVSVKSTNDVQTVFDVPYNLTLNYNYPEGWTANNLYYQPGTAGFSSGCAVLPQFNASFGSLILEVDLKPADGAQSVQIGYVTNVNNPTETFMPIQTFSNASSWTGRYRQKRVLYRSNIPNNARMAILCDGNWLFENLSVYVEPSFDVPYNEYSTFDNQPDGWIANNHYYNSNTGSWQYTTYTTGCAVLPQFNTPITSLQLQITFRSWESDAQSFAVGYVTNPNDPSSFTALQSVTSPSPNIHYTWTVNYFGVPSNARMAFKCQGGWALGGVGVTKPTITVPYTQDFQSLTVGSLPEGWYAPNMTVQNGGTTYYRLQGTGYAVLPCFEDASHNPVELNTLQLDFRCRPSIMNYGGRIRVGYIPTGGSLTSFMGLTTLDFQTYWSDYQRMYVSFGSVPAGARLAIQCTAYGSGNEWCIDDVHVYSAVTVPFTEPFATTSAPQGWASYTGQLQESGNTYTATLTPSTNAWHFGQQNGVFDSHAYTVLGANSNERKWLVSPPIILGNANDLNLSFDIGMSRQTGNQVPLTPGEQDNQKIYVFVSDDQGATWHMVKGWCGEMCGLPDLNALNPQGTTSYVNLSSYQNETILVAFYVECTDGSDNVNNVHIDNVSIMSYDVSLPPTAVTVSQVGSHSAKVSWTPASPVQYEWDVAVAPYWITNSNAMEQHASTIMTHVNGYFYTTMTGLASNNSYHAWVRYNDGTTTSAWTRTDNDFTTAEVCGHPTITNVEASPTTLFVTWEPGESDQTSFTVYVSGSDYPSEYDFENVTSALIDVSNFIEPEENYTVQVSAICSDNNEEIFSNYWSGTMAAWPTETVNDGTNTDYWAVINAYCTDAGYGSTQFVVPANQLEDLQYSSIEKLQFYCANVQNGRPWGNVKFEVRMAVVDFSNYNQFCSDSFYDWDDMSLFYDGWPSIVDGVMTIKPEDSYSGHPFRYDGGNLLIGIKQTESGGSGQARWYGVNTNVAMSGYIDCQYDPDMVQCDHFAPKVTFGYAKDSYLPPTNIVVTPIAPTEVTLTWTPREGQTATDVQLFNEDMVAMGTPWTWSNGNVFGLGNLDPGTDYYVSLRGRFTVGSETHYSAWTNPVAFTTPDYCAAPENLQVNEVGPFSATITWDNTAAYDEVEYRELATQWEEGFEGLSGDALPSGWTKFYNGNGQGSGGWWNYGTHNGVPPHSGERQMRSSGFSTYLSDNWLILPQMELGGVLKLWACTTQGAQQSFSVYVSTTGTNIADFGTTPVMTGSPLSYQEFIIDLSGFEGLGYVAIRHQDVPSGCTLVIDDVTYLNGGDWTSLGPVEGGQYDFEGLTPGHTYQARVRAMCDDDYYGYWSDPVSFSTPGNIVFQDTITKSACLYANNGWDTNGDGEISYAEAAAITDLTLIFKDQVSMRYFNELQYFTGLTAIGDNAFSGCVNLSAITLPPTITSIGYNAFGYTVNQQGQTIPCSSLHNIVIPPSVTTIGAYAFSQSGLTEVILPPSVTSIGTLAFGECNNLEYVYLPASVTSIEGNAFTGTSIETIEVDQENPVYDSRGGCNAIIQTDIDKLITGCKNTVIPNDVVSIGVSAFEYASGLTEITLPSSVESIGEYAFMNCTGLTTINAERPLPPTIYSNTFINMVHSNVTVNVPCGALSDYKSAEIWGGLSFNYVDPCNIVFADANVKAICVANWDTNHDGELSYTEAEAVTNIGTVFRDNTSIISFNELQYFTGLVGLANYAFQGCSQLTSIILPNSIIITTSGAFSGCSSLTSVTLSSSLQRIATSLFQDCSALTHIDIPATVTLIGQNAFTGCSSLTSIVIPASTTTIYNTAFNNCHGLQSIVVEPENTVYDSRNACNAIIKTETNELVIGCDNTEIPDDVVTIGANAFYGRSQMTTIVLPASVTSIGSTAFMGCGGVMEMHVNATTPPSLGNGVFGGSPAAVYPGIPVYVPCESIAAYQAAAGWSSFTNYQESDEFICFADPAVKALCVAHWDTNDDGLLSYAEAAAVGYVGLDNVFKNNTTIETFNELQYFTGMTGIYPGAFEGCTSLQEVTLPMNTQTVASRAFFGCSALSYVGNLDKVQEIGVQAFMQCTALTGLSLGANLGTIDDDAFNGCTELSYISLECAPPDFGYYPTSTFNGVDKTIPVYVPCGSVADYQTYNNGAPWGGFNSIQGMGCENSRYLSAGWTWWVPYLDVTADELRNAFDEGNITGDILINSQSEGFLRRTNGEWGGTLSDFVVGKMYKIKTVSDGSFSYNGTRPTTVAVAIEPGYNWFGIQGNSTALATLITPANGDKILKDDGTWVTFDGTYWIFDNGAYSGSFVIQPGIGYIYYNATNETKTMTFSY